MHIKKLEIAGFKSFVDRTVIHFDHDVIGIVGPNGCGKSNIVDAIRWSMGEQSAKHLRGRSMSDVIFSGSASRGPHGMAEVTLTFDNTDKAAAQALPLEYRSWGEIAVTRRLYRDGTSEYLINKTQVRLKDITDLFLGTGVGTKAYSIIEQGKIGLIVSARAEDRRLLIEEAAGITKYKARKKQAESKMDQTRQNLLRVGDIVTEIERSLASLKRQASKAERYLTYKRELEDLSLHEASHKLLEIIVLSQLEDSQQVSARDEAQQNQGALDVREAELEVVRQGTHEAEDIAERTQTEAFHAGNTVRTHEGEIDRASERYFGFEQRRQAAHNEERDLTDRLLELGNEIENLQAALAAAEEEESRGEEATAIEVEKLEELAARQREVDAELSGIRAQAADARAKAAAAEATLRGFEQRSLDLEQRRGRLEDDKLRLDLEIGELTAIHADLSAQMANLEGRRDESVALREQLSEELRGLREGAVGQEKALDAKKSDLSRVRGRLRALEEIHARMEGVGQGTKALMATADPSILGLVGDRFEALPEHTAAFAAALGERVEWVVVSDRRRGLELIASLAQSGKGRAGVVPRYPRFVAGRPSVPQVEGVVGLLSDLVRCEADDRLLASALLGNVLVTADDGSAQAVLRAGFVGSVVTLGGNLHTGEGAVIGGAKNEVAAGLLEHRREMRELEGSVATQEREVTEMLSAQQEVRTRLSDVGNELEAARSEAHSAEIAFVTADRDRKKTEEQLSALDRRLERNLGEHDEVMAKEVSAAEEHAAATENLDGQLSARELYAGQVAELEMRADGWKSEVTSQQAVVTERKVLFAQARERATAVRQTSERLERSCDEMRVRIGRLSNEQLEAAVGAGQSAARLFVEREGLTGALVLAKDAEDRLMISKTRLEEARHTLGLGEVDLKRLRSAVGEALDRLRTHEQNLEKLGIERRHLLEGIREKFRGLELERVVGDYHKRPPPDAAHRGRIVELSELLDRMGPVNLDAVREHAEAEERYTYYTTQKADLDKALADLDRAIQQMNRETKRLFRDAFEGINSRFKTIFPKMFRGGLAELRLTNPEDMLETGIEILAQPPGKKLSSIELMSGGEKALTAVSLIFAIFDFKPSPFCILDEVDAPLDEANVTRYNEAIRMMTERSQFILITHIKRTMQSVDVLYGVTMQEPGVSKLVSVKINERAVSRSASIPAENLVEQVEAAEAEIEEAVAVA